MRFRRDAPLAIIGAVTLAIAALTRSTNSMFASQMAAAESRQPWVERRAAPTHSLAPTLSQGPVALANGTYELRAAIANPDGRTLTAIARQPHPRHSAHARVEGNELIMLYAPDQTVPIRRLMSWGLTAILRRIPLAARVL
jgi:hypothetical protein